MLQQNVLQAQQRNQCQQPAPQATNLLTLEIQEEPWKKALTFTDIKSQQQQTEFPRHKKVGRDMHCLDLKKPLSDGKSRNTD